MRVDSNNNISENEGINSDFESNTNENSVVYFILTFKL